MNEKTATYLRTIIFIGVVGAILFYFREGIGNWLVESVMPEAKAALDLLLIGACGFILYKLYKFYQEREDYLNRLILVNKTCSQRFYNLYHNGIKYSRTKNRNLGTKYIREASSTYFDFIRTDGINLIYNGFEKNKELRNIKMQLRNIIKDPVEKSLSISELQRMHKKYSCIVCNGTAINREGVEKPLCDRCKEYDR